MGDDQKQLDVASNEMMINALHPEIARPRLKKTRESHHSAGREVPLRGV
jgi:hypothetical protein